MRQLPLKDVEIEDDLGDDVIPFKYSITSYGADYPVDGLVRRIKDGSIIVPSFQRGYVWNIKQASRFIESLLLGLPVPGIFLSREMESSKLLVIDGQQRLRTLQYFYGGLFKPTKTIFALSEDDVQAEFRGLTYDTLSADDKVKLDDFLIHATIIRQEEPSGENSSIYYVFERLNSTGVTLQDQEIRAALYHGKFNQLLNTLNNNPDWRTLFGPTHKRMRDQELILRFIAFQFAHSEYSKPMKAFLNKFMGRNRDLSKFSESEITYLFENTVKVIREAIGSKAFKPKRAVNAAVLDSVMVGIASRLQKAPIHDYAMVYDAYELLLKDSVYSLVTATGTADEENVRKRIEFAINAFDKVV